jgi:hypothetical protein
MDDAFAVSRMPEIGLSGSMWRGPETARWQTYSGTKPETADTDKASLQRHRAGPRPDRALPHDGSNAERARAFDALDGSRIREDLGFKPKFPRLADAIAAGA